MGAALTCSSPYNLTYSVVSRLLNIYAADSLLTTCEVKGDQICVC